MVQHGFFDVNERLAALSAAGDPLKQLLRWLISSFSGRFWPRRSSVRTGAGVEGRPMIPC